MRHRLALGLVATAACAASVVATAPGASAGSRPTAALRAVHSKITAGHAPSFRYAVTHTRTTKVVLQRQFGTQHAWKTVRTTKHARGTLTAAKLTQLGKYVYRIRALLHGHVKATSPSRTVYAYGTISLGDVLNSGSHTVSFQGRLYRYVWRNDYGDTQTILHRNKTSCRSMRLTVIAKTGDSSDPDSRLQVIQETADPSRVQVPANTQKSLSVTLSGDAFSLSSTDRTTDGGLFGNGALSCWTENAALPR